MDFYLQSNNSYNRLEEEFKKYGKLIFCVDFDDTIYDFHKKGRTYENVISLLHRWEKYSEVIIFTGNGEDKYEMIEQYLKDNNIKYKGVNCDSSVAFSGRKIYANVYIDDRGGLIQIYNELLTLIEKIENEMLNMSEFDAKEVKNEVVQWIRNWFNENGNDCCAVVGISGGKDSSKERIDSMHEKNLFKLQLMPSFEYAVNPQTEVLNNKQTGYDVVSKYIKKYWECHCTEDVIVSIEISRDGKNYERINEVASPYNMYDVEFLNDWWEGERYVRVNGIQGISGIKCENI